MNKYNIKKLAYFALMMAFLVTAIITTSIGVITNELINSGLYSVVALGYVISARSFGYLLGAFASIKAFRKISYLRIVPFYFLIIALLMTAMFYQNNLLVLIIVFMIFGILKNLITVGGNQISAYFYKMDIQKSLMNNLQFIYGIGTFFSPLCIGYILTTSNMNAVIVFFISISLGISLFFICQKNTKSIQISSEETTTDSNKKVIVLINFFFAIYAGFEIFIGTWGNFVMTTKLQNQDFIYWGNALFWLALAFSKIVLNKFKAVTNNQNYIVVASIFLTMIFTIVYMKTTGDVIILLVMFFLGACMGNIVPSTIKYLSITNKVNSGETAWCFVGAGIGGVFFSKIYSNIFEIGISYSFLVAFAQLVVLIIIFMFLSKGTFLQSKKQH